MTIKDLKQNGLIILDCISGSQAYGLATPASDTDIKGVFLLPKKDFYGLNYIPQISNPTNDIVYYELGRFMELLAVNNPNILELLNTPPNKILYKHPFLDSINPKLILSKRCRQTFGQFALSQIKKAKGLKKKIVNPVAKERKDLLAFCYIHQNKGSIPLLDFLKRKNWQQEHCGLVKIPHMKHIYGLYYNPTANYQGIIRSVHSNEVSLSSIPKEERELAILYVNQDGYSTYCKEYREYWAWVENRNEARYENTKSHGKNYDAKNMMHTFRLLDMAIEIARDQQINVKRPNRSFLLQIKNGQFEYADLLAMAKKKQTEMEQAFELSTLPEQPNIALIRQLTYQIRQKFYSKT